MKAARHWLGQLLLLALVLTPARVQAETPRLAPAPPTPRIEHAPPAAEPAATPRTPARGRIVGHLDGIGRSNPVALALIAGVYYRHVWARDADLAYDLGYFQVGVAGLINPAYVQPSIHVELLPLPFLVLRLEYALQSFVGANRGLLSFDSAKAPFGESILRRRSAESKATVAQRVAAEVVLRGKVQRFIARNASDLYFYDYRAKGPYLYESEFDTLLEPSDFLFNNRLQFGLDLSTQATPELTLLGPFYEVTWASGAALRRQRVGGFCYWEAEQAVFGVAHARVYGVSGVDLEDPNRNHSVFFLVGAGADIGG